MADLELMSLKTTLLLALASVKCVGDLQALSINASCLEFGPKTVRLNFSPVVQWNLYRGDLCGCQLVVAIYLC